MKNHIKLTDRQTKILEIIINEYTKHSEPIGSKYIAEKFLTDFSPQTIRNEMAYLEKHGFLEKTHTSSGRIPSVKAFEYYEKNLNQNFALDVNIQNKLNEVFQKRAEDIDLIIDESLDIINEITNLPSVSNSILRKNELISKISAIQLDDYNGLIILVTSSGNITKSNFNIKNQQQFNDVEVCIDIFNQHLVKTPLGEIQNSILKIQEIIRKNVHEYEFITREIFMRLFSLARTSNKQRIVGISSIFQHPEFQDPQKIAQVIKMIEKGNIWRQIHFDNEQKNATININKSIPESPLAIASTEININHSVHQISVIGPDKMNYAPIKAILNFLKKQLEETFNPVNQETNKDEK